MAEYLNNGTQDLIYHFLDGEADAGQQKVLFDALAENNELQSEFNQAVELNKALNFDKMNLTPSAALTDNLFKRAGFNTGAPAPVQHAPVSWTANFLSRVSNLINRYAAGTAAALVSASIIFSVYNTIDSKLNNKSDNQVNINKSQAANLVANKADNYPVASSGVQTTAKIVKKSNSKNTTNNNIDNDFNTALKNTPKSNSIIPADLQNDNEALESNNDNKDLAVNNEVVSREKYNTLAESSSDNKFNYSLSGIPVSNGSFPNYSPMALDFGIDEKLNLTLEMGGISALNYYPSRTIDGASTGINNMNFTVRYNFNENHALGLTGGKESLQMYEITKNKNKYKFNKESDILWAGIDYKYTMDEIAGLYNLQPYGEASFGGTKYGPVSKAAVGLTYNLFNSLNLSLGFEWTSLVYTEVNAIKATHKTGIVYKLSYNF